MTYRLASNPPRVQTVSRFRGIGSAYGRFDCPAGQQYNGSGCVSVCASGQQWVDGKGCVTIGGWGPSAPKPLVDPFASSRCGKGEYWSTVANKCLNTATSTDLNTRPPTSAPSATWQDCPPDQEWSDATNSCLTRCQQTGTHWDDRVKQCVFPSDPFAAARAQNYANASPSDTTPKDIPTEDKPPEDTPKQVTDTRSDTDPTTVKVTYGDIPGGCPPGYVRGGRGDCYPPEGAPTTTYTYSRPATTNAGPTPAMTNPTKDKTMLYVGAGIAILALLGGVYYLSKRKK